MPKPNNLPEPPEDKSLPGPEVIDDETTRDRVKELLADAERYRKQEKDAKEELDRIKQEVMLYLKAQKLPGVRQGLLGIGYYGWKTNRSLDKGRLIEAGLTPDQLNDCYVESGAWEDVRFIAYKP